MANVLDLFSSIPRYKRLIYDYILDLIDYTELHFTIQENNYYNELGLQELSNDNIDNPDNETKFNIECKKIVSKDNFKVLNTYCEAIKKYISYKKKYKALPSNISRNILENRDYYYSMFVTFVSVIIIDFIRPNTKFEQNFNRYVEYLLDFKQPPPVPKKFIDSGKQEMFSNFWIMFTDFCNAFRERIPSIDFSVPSQETQDSREREYANLVEYFNTLHTAGPLLRNKPISTGLRRNISGGKRSVVSKIHRPRRKYAKSKSAKQNRSKSLRRHRRRTSRK